MKITIALLLVLILKSINPHIFPVWGWRVFWLAFLLAAIGSLAHDLIEMGG